MEILPGDSGRDGTGVGAGVRGDKKYQDGYIFGGYIFGGRGERFGLVFFIFSTEVSIPVLLPASGPRFTSIKSKLSFLMSLENILAKGVGLGRGGICGGRALSPALP